MGCGGSKSVAEGEATSKEIDKQLKSDQNKVKSEVKLLLLGMPLCTVPAAAVAWPEPARLTASFPTSGPRHCLFRRGTGAGESGKSTVLKQMKILHQGGYSPEERESYREIIWSNTIQSMQVLLRGMSTINPPIPFDDPVMEVRWVMAGSLSSAQALTPLAGLPFMGCEHATETVRGYPQPGVAGRRLCVYAGDRQAYQGAVAAPGRAGDLCAVERAAAQRLGQIVRRLPSEEGVPPLQAACSQRGTELTYAVGGG